MSDIPVSVVIVSRGRPAALTRCLTGVSQLIYPHFEVIVVADPDGIGAANALGFANDLKLVACDEANISVARNAGVAAAAGEVVAFIDDDAVPEPTWLSHLAAAFEDVQVMAAGGFVRGRNGISFQWKANSIDVTGGAKPLDVDEREPTVLSPTPDHAIKTEGTNMAMRRDVLVEIGGFDPAFRFFLDETDLNMRLAKLGHATAIVPLAEVHHGYLASDRRTNARVPRDLREMGASLAVYLRKHCPEFRRDAVWQHTQIEQKNLLLRHMVSGALEPGDVRRLMAGLQAGYTDGLSRSLEQMPMISRAPDGFSRFPGNVGAQSIVFYGAWWRRRQVRRQAAEAVALGDIVSTFIFSRTALFQKVRFRAGVWEQRGGLFGRSLRTDPMFRLTTFGRRVRREKTRIAAQRGMSEI